MFLFSRQMLTSIHQLFLSGLTSSYGRLNLNEAGSPKPESHNVVSAKETNAEKKQNKHKSPYSLTNIPKEKVIANLIPCNFLLFLLL